LKRALGIYLVAVVLVSLGMYVHVFLFNLYLADLGLREDVMGRLASAMTLGTLLGTLPAAALVRRAGLKATIVVSVAGLAASLIVRVLVAGPALSAASLVAGLFLAGWFVTNFPAIAGLTAHSSQADEQRKARAFSLNTALAIGVGAAGGMLAGHLPGWIGVTSQAAAKRWALLLAAVPVALGALVVAVAVRFPRETDGQTAPGETGWGSLALLRRSSARGFLLRFLSAVGLWYAFGAGFHPFLNIYLRNRIGASLEAIGGVMALAHVIQALAALLMAPLVRWLGLVRAVVATQLLASAGVLALWPTHTLGTAAAIYMIYISLQVMSEPGLQNLLMSRVPPGHRAAASAANLFLMFGVQALIGATAGMLIVIRGYALLFIVLALVGILSAVLFGILFSGALHCENAPPASGAGNYPGRRE